jgi:acylphosphatase
MQHAIHVFYSGRVQGVGFRYTVREIAVESGVSGWVKNLGDGRVEVVAEGEEQVLKDFLSMIRDNFSPAVHTIEVSWEPATGSFRDFFIKF